MVLSSASPAGVQDITVLLTQLFESITYLNSAVDSLNQLRGIFTTDITGRLRVLIDNITGALTLSTVTTVGTVTDVTRIDGFGTSTAGYNFTATLMPMNDMNRTIAENLRANITTA